jgi:hypothetical protein
MKRIRGIILCLTFCLPILTGQIVILPATAYAQSSGRNFFLYVDVPSQGP